MTTHSIVPSGRPAVAAFDRGIGTVLVLHDERMTEHPEDLPSSDSPSGSDADLDGDEPAPAEVVGTEDDPAQLDLSLDPRLENVDEYRRETLDERLHEEEPDRAAQAREPERDER
jgi:hypothetical protein